MITDGIVKGAENMENIWIALEIMWKGMAGIFAAVLVIMVIVYFMGKMGRK